MDQEYKVTNNLENSNTNEDTVSNKVTMDEQTTTTQGSKDPKVNEYLTGINEFLDKMKNLQGGGSPVVANERAKIAKLFNILSIEALLTEAKKNSAVNET